MKYIVCVLHHFNNYNILRNTTLSHHSCFFFKDERLHTNTAVARLFKCLKEKLTSLMVLRA